MKRIKLTIEYDGSSYSGWQKQKSGKTIQEEIEKCLKELFEEKINLYVSGRTDAGVHALAQVAHFDVSKLNIKVEKISFAINQLLKKNNNKITILKSTKVNSFFDSRFSVKEKTYLYKILNRPTVSFLTENRVWFVPQKIDIDHMRDSCSVLIGKYDFNAFRSSNCQSKNSLRSIKKIKIKKIKDFIEIRVVGKSFLYNQVRIMVGTLVKVGKQEWDKKKILEILNSKNRRNAGPTAPACGLYLEKITY